MNTGTSSTLKGVPLCFCVPKFGKGQPVVSPKGNMAIQLHDHGWW